MKKSFRNLFGVLMILAGAMHICFPEKYLPFFDSPVLNLLPAKICIYLSGVLEILTGVAVLVPLTATLGTWTLVALMIGFLPLHILDVFKEHPAIGSHSAAWVRLPLQFVLIAWAWWIRPSAKESFRTVVER